MSAHGTPHPAYPEPGAPPVAVPPSLMGSEGGQWCTDPKCTTCVEEQLYSGLFAERAEDARVDAALERTLQEIAEEQRLAAEAERD